MANNLEKFIKEEVDIFLVCAEKLKKGEMTCRDKIGEDYRGVILYNGDLEFLEKIRTGMESVLEKKGEGYPVVCSPSIDSQRMLEIGFYCINVGGLVDIRDLQY